MFFCHDYCPSLSVDKMPMPSLKMKTNQTTDCLKEKNGIHVCPMSTKISKTSLSRLKIVQNAEDVASIVQTTQSVSCDKERSIETEDEFHNNETVDRDTLKCQKHHESLTKWTTLSCKMESMPALSPTNFDHIFSPIMESIDINSDAYLKYFNGDNILSVPQLESEDSDDISKESLSREYYGCRISDFSISDLINFTSIPFLSELTYYDDNTDVRFFPDPKCEELIASFEMDSTEHKPFSYLNSDVENGYIQDNRVSENVTVSCDSSLYFSIHQSRSSNSESERNCSYGDAEQTDCFDPHTFIRNLPDLPDLASDLSSSIPSNDRNTTKRVTLALDLDETLVHSTWEQCDDVDFTFIVFFNTTVYVKKRPHLHAFLNRVAEMFDIVIFTASQSIYAKPILDKLDPDGKIISNRAYRESCIFSNGSYTKDLTVLGVDLAKVFIIDNSPQVFRLQVNNGIPIKSWFDDPSDSALLSLLPFLETLVDVDDVRPVIAKRFGNHKD